MQATLSTATMFWPIANREPASNIFSPSYHPPMPFWTICEAALVRRNSTSASSYWLKKPLLQRWPPCCDGPITRCLVSPTCPRGLANESRSDSWGGGHGFPGVPQLSPCSAKCQYCQWPITGMASSTAFNSSNSLNPGLPKEKPCSRQQVALPSLWPAFWNRSLP